MAAVKASQILAMLETVDTCGGLRCTVLAEGAAT